MSVSPSLPKNADASVRAPLTSFDYLLYGLTVFAWSASWYALKVQVGVVPVQVSLVWRFAIAAAIMLVWAILVKAPLRFSLSLHVKFALLGAFLFCMNFALFYHASPYLASGLLSVVFSLVAAFNIVIAIVVKGTRPTKNTAIGVVLGMGGIALMFWPVIAGQVFDKYALIALGLCALGTLSFCTGNLISTSLQAKKIPIVSASFWGMLYGTILSTIIALVQGDAFIIDWNATYLVSLVFLAVISSVVAFASYLTLLGRIGSDRAGYATVMFPVIALVISAVFEDYQMGLIAGLGLVLVLAGNVFVLGKFGKG